MKRKNVKYIKYYTLSDGRTPFLSHFDWMEKGSPILSMKISYDYDHDVRLTDPFTVVNSKQEVIFKVTEPEHIAIITAHLLTLDEKPFPDWVEYTNTIQSFRQDHKVTGERVEQKVKFTER